MSNLIEQSEPIRCILSDVDGVLTDGRIVYDESLRETKAFHARDGLGIKLWMQSGFHFGIITARSGRIVAHRAAELGINLIRQGCESKWPAAEQILSEINCTPEQTCYIGDDLPDLTVMKNVGLSATPSDASSDVTDAADWILTRGGGQGVVRELIERLMRAKGRWEEHVPG